MQQDHPVAWAAFAGRNGANIKTHNLQTVLLTLLFQGPVSRARMAELTGLSTTTITNLMSELLMLGIVAEDGHEAYERHGAGERISIRLVPTARYAVGVHLDVDNVRVAVADLAGNVGPYRTVVPPAGAEPDFVLHTAAEMAEELLAEAGIDRERVVGVGVGASGLVNPETGVNELAPNLGWHNLPIGDRLARQLGLPVTVENNVRAMALAESMFGAGRNASSLAFVYARVGVGAGFVLGGRLYRGVQGGAGEIGHNTIIPVGGRPCHCGNTGCLETLVSEPAIVARAQQHARQAPDSLLAAKQGEVSGIDQVFAAARAGDVSALRILDEAALYMGIALANLVNVLNPELIVLGGLFAAGQDLLLPTIETTLRQRAFGGLGWQAELRAPTFGGLTGVLGAAALALNSFFYRRAAPLPLLLPHPSGEIT